MISCIDNEKRTLGQYYTEQFNPFALHPFLNWKGRKLLQSCTVLEPFAGGNHIIRCLQERGLCKSFTSYDISPSHEEVTHRNTLHSFPVGYKICITNPPWLYKSSARRRGLPFPSTCYTDLYQYALSLCLEYCEYVAALLPASFLNSGLFRDRLSSYILLHKKVFAYTDNPVCLALFNPTEREDISIYYDNEHIGYLHELEKHMPPPKANTKLRVNDANGSLGFVGIDDTSGASMRFCRGEELEEYNIIYSSRSITRLSGVDATDTAIRDLNHALKSFRGDTQDIFLTPFKGLRKDGRYRRRMDFRLLKRIISTTNGGQS